MQSENRFRCCGGGGSAGAFFVALPSEDPEDADDGARRSLRLSLLKSAGVRVFSSSELPAAVCASVSTQTEAHEAQARVAAERRCLAESALFDSLTAHALAGESSCTDGDISTQRALRREAAEAAESAFARAYVFDGRKKAEKTSAPQQQQRFVEICGCVCAVCASCSCGLWLDALRVLGASDHELFFLQTAEPLARDAETGGPESLGRNLHCQLSSAAANTRAEKSSVGNKRRSDDDDEANEGLRRLRWGVFGGCAGGTSLRRCLRVIREFPLLISAREEKAPSDTGPAPAASPGERGRSLLLAEALLKQTESLAREFSRPANAVSRGAVRVDLEGSLRLRVAAAHARCFLHPALCAADFEVEGRGLVATDAIGVGELVVQIPVRELVGAYAALVHPVFGRVASVMLGAASAEEQPRKKRQREAGQPLVDSDACCCLYLLFLAFAMGLQGGAALLQFLPAASPSDAAGVASAVGMAPDEQRAAAERASLQIPLLHGPPEAVDFAARVFPSVASTTETTHERAFSVYRQLMDILRPLFPAPPESSPQELERRGVLHACTRAAQAAAFADAQAMRVVRESASQGRGGVAAAAAAVAVSAAAREAAERGRSPWTRTSGERTELESAEAALVGEFLSILDYQDFLWAEQVLASRSFSACPPPLSPLREVAQQTQTAAPAAEREGDCSEEEQDEEEEKEEETEEEEEDAAVPFLPELPERRGCSAGFSSSRGRGSESERRLTAAVALIETPFSSPTFSTSSPDGQGAAAALVRVPRRCACFIPFAELLNHHPLAQVGPPVLETRRSVASEGGEETEKSELVLSLRVITQVAQGAQVYLHYGPLQSWEFATFFGFVPSQPLLAPFDCWSSSESGHESSFAEGNPDDVLALQLKVDAEDPEVDLKETVLRLQKLPEALLLRAETLGRARTPALSAKALAALWVIGHPSLGEFIAAASSALPQIKKGDVQAAERAARTFAQNSTTAESALKAAVAGALQKQGLWSASALKAAIEADPEASSHCRRLLQVALEAVAEKLDSCQAELEDWKAQPQNAPFWVRRCGGVLLRLVQNQRRLVDQQTRLAETAFPTRTPRQSAVLEA